MCKLSIAVTFVALEGAEVRGDDPVYARQVNGGIQPTDICRLLPALRLSAGTGRRRHHNVTCHDGHRLRFQMADRLGARGLIFIVQCSVDVLAVIAFCTSV